MKSAIQKAFFLLICLVYSVTGYTQSHLLLSGPMVGYTDFFETLIWVQVKQKANVHIKYWQKENKKDVFSSEKQSADPLKAHIVKFILNKVQPGKQYNYSVYINDIQVQRPYKLEFKMRDLYVGRKPVPDFHLAMGSCAYIFDPEYDYKINNSNAYPADYRIFQKILDKGPDFMLWLGDNVYLRDEKDWNSRTGFYKQYTTTRSAKEMQPLLGSVANYAIWDNHDYGPSNSNRSFYNKKIAQEVFELFWGNPNYDVIGKGGVAGSFTYYDAQFFLLDNRYFRAPYEDTSRDKPLFGEDQINWLIDALRSSSATFKIIAQGGQFLSTSFRPQNYMGYPKEREIFLQRIKEAGIEGVIFLSGDRHHTELTKLEIPGFYPLYDLTVSPLTTNAANRERSMNDGNTLRVPNTLVNVWNFSVIDITGTERERKLTITIYDWNGGKLWDYVINAKDLKIKK